MAGKINLATLLEYQPAKGSLLYGQALRRESVEGIRGGLVKYVRNIAPKSFELAMNNATVNVSSMNLDWVPAMGTAMDVKIPADALLASIKTAAIAPLATASGMTLNEVTFTCLLCAHMLAASFDPARAVPVRYVQDSFNAVIKDIASDITKPDPFVCVVFLPNSHHYVVAYRVTTDAVVLYDPMSTEMDETMALQSELTRVTGKHINMSRGEQGIILGVNVCGFLAAHCAAWVAMSHVNNTYAPFKQPYLAGLYAMLTRAHDMQNVP